MRNSRGLTLLEVLAALAILTLMATVSLPLIQDAAQWSRSNDFNDSDLDFRVHGWTPPIDQSLEEHDVKGELELLPLSPFPSGEDLEHSWVLLRHGELLVPRFLSERSLENADPTLEALK